MGVGKSKIVDEQTRSLRELVRKKDVRLLKASVLAGLLSECKLRDLNRQGLETKHSQVFANNALVERCLREVEAAKSRRQCAYPGVVVISHAWQTAEHPDPSGSLGKKLAVYLHWYAVQRSRWTRERLYRKDANRKSDRIHDLDFDIDFVVLIDFWSLNQAPRTEKQAASFTRARQAMHHWLGHRGITVFLITSVPSDWHSNQEFNERGGFHRRGWPAFERRVAALGKGGGVTLDMGGFDEMLVQAKLVRMDLDGTAHVGEEYGSKAAILSGRFEGAKESQLQHLAMWDRAGHSARERVANGAYALGESCLVHLVEGRQLPPLVPAEMEAELAGKAFAEDDDRPACAAMYDALARATLGDEEVLDFDGVGHWKEREFGSVAAALALCVRVRLLKLNHCAMTSPELAAFAAGLRTGTAPDLEELEILGNDIREPGLEALARAVRSGALPRLRRVVGVAYGAMGEGWEGRVGEALGQAVTHDQGMLTLTSQLPPRPVMLQGVDARLDDTHATSCCQWPG